MITPREWELINEITPIIDQITATLKAFAKTQDLDELDDMLKVHEDRLRPLLDELKAVQQQRRGAKR